VFLDHGSRPRVHRLEWRIRLMGVGAILAVIGMYFEARWMIWIAIAVLVLGFLLRFLPRDGRGPDDADELDENR
jgi:hypothetical protein